MQRVDGGSTDSPEEYDMSDRRQPTEMDFWWTGTTYFREISDSDEPDDTMEWSRWGPDMVCLLYTSPSPRDQRGSRMPSCA